LSEPGFVGFKGFKLRGSGEFKVDLCLSKRLSAPGFRGFYGFELRGGGEFKRDLCLSECAV
jgi:hypothetical protein